MVAAIDRIIALIDVKIEGTDKVKNFDKVLRNMKANMLGFGLSMLFTGMAIKRFADTALRALGNTFMTLADEQNAGLKNVMALQAAFQFLKFTIFDTFANSEMFTNLTVKLVDMANAVSEFIQKNPGISKAIGLFLTLSAILGTIMMVIGQTVLATIGLISGWSLISTTVVPIIKTILGLLGGIGGGSLLGTIGLIVLAVIAAYIAFKENFGKITDYAKTTFNNILGFLKSIIGNFKDIFDGLIIFLEGIFTGDLDKILEGAWKMIKNFLAILAKGVVMVGSLIANAVISAINVTLAAFENMINIALQAIRKISEFLEWSIPSWAQSNISLDRVENLDVTGAFGAIDDFLNSGDSDNTVKLDQESTERIGHSVGKSIRQDLPSYFNLQSSTEF